MKLYRPAKLERIEVVWEDAQADSEYDGTGEGFDATLPTLEDIGYFVALTRDVLVLAGCREPSTGTVRFLLKIPRKLIREVRSLERPAPEVA